MAKPFWIREAKLPEGFPLPGPVGTVVIKEYPSYRMARFAAWEGQPAHQDTMFWPLFKHIQRNNIAMTAPVEIGYPAALATRPDAADRAEPVSMAFLYRQPTLGTTGADQADTRVVVVDVPAMTVLSVGMRGDYTKSRLANALGLLAKWMAENPGCVEVVGKPRYLGYNSPTVPSFLRYGEVQLPVRHLTQSSQPTPTQP
ncbi:MAG: heme-binding protein [Phycisphaerae bacterium]|nr:heme-binding protein [Phycisphaerae bacterium]